MQVRQPRPDRCALSSWTAPPGMVSMSSLLGTICLHSPLNIVTLVRSTIPLRHCPTLGIDMENPNSLTPLAQSSADLTSFGRGWKGCKGRYPNWKRSIAPLSKRAARMKREPSRQKLPKRWPRRSVRNTRLQALCVRSPIRQRADLPQRAPAGGTCGRMDKRGESDVSRAPKPSGSEPASRTDQIGGQGLS